MQYEYALLSARLDLMKKDPSLLSAGGECHRRFARYHRLINFQNSFSPHHPLFSN